MDKQTPDEVIARLNKERDRCKVRVEVELHDIQVDELVESAIEPGSWFRENIGHNPVSPAFWETLPRYIVDCIKAPHHMSDTVVRLHIQQAIQKYRSKFK